ncbi:MAG: hypothetical protein U0271_44840 [Polyangiaceae bacterium]
MLTLHRKFWPLLERAAEEPSQTFFYEVLPSAQIAFKHGSYQAEAELTRTVLEELVPAIFQLLAPPNVAVTSRLGPGGYKGKTSPSIHSELRIEDAPASVVAAGIGWVFRQYSVLVADLRDSLEGTCPYAIVDLGPEQLSVAEAERFLNHATLNPQLPKGYTAFGDDLLVLNLPDAGNAPLPETEFFKQMGEAAAGFCEGATIAQTGRADARMIQNDWKLRADGEAYAELLRAVDMAELHRLRQRHTEIVTQWLNRV